jgi:hypothetical protein
MARQRRPPINVRIWEFVRRGTKTQHWIWRGNFGLRREPTVVLLMDDWETLDVHELFGTNASEGCSTKLPAPRVMWGLIRGPVPRDKLVIKTCLIPECVNPHHQKLGLRQEASTLACKKKRIPNGSKARSAVLTTRKVKSIVRQYFSTETTLAELGRRYGVSLQTIRAVVCGQTWTQVTGLARDNLLTDRARQIRFRRKPPVVRFRD